MSIVKDFKEFVLRGNVVDLAVGIVIGGAFGKLVNTLVKDIITPLIAIPGKFSFADWVIIIHGSKFAIGEFVNDLVSFVILAATVFFFVVKPLNVLTSLGKKDQPVEPDTKECPECLSKIPVKATRCAFCTAQQPLQ